MSSSVRYAVIIGINDYSAFDASTGRPAGSSDLKGAVNDAKLYLHLATRLGVPAANTRVLVAPAGGAARPAAFDGVPGDLPTDANIRAAFQWLVDALAADPGAQAILTYSGHGDVEEGHLVLCPTDMAEQKGVLQNAINLSGIGDVLDPISQTNLITVFLDCCHAGDADPASRALRTLEAPVKITHELSNGHPVIAACKANAVSSEVCFGDTYFGAFSWSITQVLSRWQEDGDGDPRYGIAYGEAPIRASMLMNALAVEQTPVYEGTPHQARSRMFTRADTRTQAPPAAPRRELYPGDNGVYRIYYVYDKAGHHVMSALVTGPNYNGGQNYAPNMEYWTYTTSAVSYLQTTSQIWFYNKHTATSTTSNPNSNGYANLGYSSAQSQQNFKASAPSNIFSFNTLFTRESGTTALSFTWNGSTILQMNWFHDSSGLLFSGSNTGNLSNPHFNAASTNYVTQTF